MTPSFVRWLWLCGPCVAWQLLAGEARMAARYERLFREAQALVRNEPTNAVATWQFARACFDRAEWATNGAQRIEIANQGIAAARQALALQPGLAAAHYYLAMNLGQVARVKRFSALGLLDDMIREFEATRASDAAFDFAGPDRNLGLIYRDAPGWPLGPGNRKKARLHLGRAVALSKDYPENQLNLLESWLKWGERPKVAAELRNVESVLQAARQKFAGEEWASSWADWNPRWQALQKKAAEPLRPATSPRGSK